MSDVDFSQYKEGTTGPWYERRFWLRQRNVEPLRYEDGTEGASTELYVPFWAWPFEGLHRLLFGTVRLEIET